MQYATPHFQQYNITYTNQYTNPITNLIDLVETDACCMTSSELDADCVFIPRILSKLSNIFESVTKTMKKCWTIHQPFDWNFVLS